MYTRLLKLSSGTFFRNTLTPRRNISHFSKDIWPSLPVEEKMQIALTESKPHNPETSYYKGLALLKMGNQFVGEAISAFEEVYKNESAPASLRYLAEKRVSSLYEKQGDFPKAYEALKKSHEYLISSSEKMKESYEHFLEGTSNDSVEIKAFKRS